MVGRLTEGYMDRLEQWIGTGAKTFTLLYAVTRDGCNATIFHQKCDNQGPTVTVLYNQQGSVYGGYTSANWNGSGHVNTTDSFLFQLQYNSSLKVNKFTLKHPQYSIYRNSTYGPIFGGGNDLHTFKNTVNNAGGYFPLNGSMNIGHSYDNQGITTDQINNGNMNVTELEVYSVADGQRRKQVNPKDLKPWRKTKVWNEQFSNELKEEIVSFKPLDDVKMTEARILMIGPVGAGKSSFYNTLDSVFRGRITHRARCGSTQQSLTTTFNPTAPIFPRTPGFRSDPTPNDEIHCAVFVLDSTTLDVLPSKLMEKIKRFQDIMNLKGIPQLVILPKIDKLCKEVEKEISDVFQSEAVGKHVEKTAQLLGLPRVNILPVKNYENEDDLDLNINILALLSLRRILNFTEDYFHNLSFQKKDLQKGMEKLQMKK